MRLVISIMSFVLTALLIGTNGEGRLCGQSVTTASGNLFKNDGDLIFEDNFDKLDFNKWKHENTLSGGGNWEFQWYTNDRENTFTENGILHIVPTLTADVFDESFLKYGSIDVNGGNPADACTNPLNYGCSRVGTPQNILNPIRSARLRTYESFNFKYGKVEVRAKVSSGDWLWPAIWMMPKNNVYGGWPASGEIDIMETRGNRNLKANGINIGTEQITSTIHYGPTWDNRKSNTFYNNTGNSKSFSDDFYRYQLEWTPDKLVFSINDERIGIKTIDKDFWTAGEFATTKQKIKNPWRYATKTAPYDDEFFLIINLAVGGNNYFPDDSQNPGGKPWKNTSPTAAADFWNGRNQWLPTWKLGQGDSSSFLIDYVRVYAI